MSDINYNQFISVDLVIDHIDDGVFAVNQPSSYASEGDLNGRTANIQITERGKVGAISGLSINAVWTNFATGVTDITALELIDEDTSVYRFTYPSYMMTAGRVEVKFQLIYNGKVSLTRPFIITVLATKGNFSALIESQQFSALTQALNHVNQYDTAIAKKVDQTEYDIAIASKADKQDTNNSLASLQQSKADKSFVDSQFASIVSGAPKGTFATLAALQTAYPSGTEGVFLVLENGHWYYYASGWKDGGVYQAMGVADESITMEKTFGIVTRSGNYYDYTRATRGKKLDITTGLEVSNASYAVSDYEPVFGLSGNYYATINGVNACFYAKDKTFLTGVENVRFSHGRKIPDGAYWQRISVINSTYQDDMLAITKNQLTADPVYTEYIKKIIGLRTQAEYIDKPIKVIDRIPDKYLSVNKLSDLSFAYNVLNPKALVDEEINTDGTFTASTLKKRTPFLPIKAGDYYGSIPSLTAYFYDESFNFLYMQDNTSFATTRRVPTTYTTVRFVVFCSTINNITWVDSDGNPAMAVISALPIGSSVPPYTPFGYKIGNELIAIKNDKTNVSFLSPKYVYTVYNDLNPARQIGARMYLDHFFAFVSDDDNAVFRENKKDWWSLVAPNNNNNLAKTEISKTNYIDSDKYVSKKISVTQRSVKASSGVSAPVRILQIGDSMTYSVPSSGPFGGSYPSWGYIKKLFELDKIDNGDAGFDVELMGSNPNVAIPIDYSGVTKTVRAGAEGFGGWGLTTAMHHPTRIDPSQASWDLLGLGNGSGTDYTGSQVQKDLIRTTPQYGVEGAFNPFYDSTVTSGTPFSILKYLKKYRTRLDDGTKLTLGHAQLGTRITTQEQIDNWYIATPTHIILQHGRNDEPYINAFNTAAQAFITKVKAELPSVKIGFAIPADAVGTMFPSKYPNVVNISGEGMDRVVNRSGSYGIANVLLTNYSNMEADGVYLVPNYFVGATGFGINLKEIENMDSDDKTYALDLGADYSHPNFKFCHRAWAYQMYGWIKYTLA